MRTPNNSAEMCEVLLNFKGAYDSGRGEQSDSPGQRGARSSQFNVFFFSSDVSNEGIWFSREKSRV